jgi:hypothetical protein
MRASDLKRLKMPVDGVLEGAPVIHLWDAGHSEVMFEAGPPDREDGCHMVDAFRPLYEHKNACNITDQRALFWSLFEEVEREPLRPVIWVRERRDASI